MAKNKDGIEKGKPLNFDELNTLISKQRQAAKKAKTAKKPAAPKKAKADAAKPKK